MLPYRWRPVVCLPVAAQSPMPHCMLQLAAQAQKAYTSRSLAADIAQLWLAFMDCSRTLVLLPDLASHF